MSMTAQPRRTSAIPGRDHYSSRYLRDGRLFSYAHQIDAALLFEPMSVLEVGVGGGIVASILRSLGITVTTLDVQPELQPDIVASVTDVPLEERSVDVALCCQVLEHLPYDSLQSSIRELARVAKRGVVLSLPDVSRSVGLSVATPPRYAPRLRSITIPNPMPAPIPRERFNVAGHHWEIGYKGFPLRRIIDSIDRAGMVVHRSWRVFEKPWHRFFDLRHH